EDKNLQRYVNRVGRWVASQSSRPDLPWVFGVIETPTINAFALPGGKVFISIGLLKTFE
ncbi:MAG: M48 family metalloprotease, partial [Gammaproteobacteria bacterium]|nr:M48 family metalloprotease [Gammaproteobacteria bacterium]